jgi:hypothetical protein
MFKQGIFSLLLLLGASDLWSQHEITPGVQFNDDRYKQIPRRATRRGAKSVPKNTSLKIYAPQAGNQADRSTCLAWATAYALTIQEARQLGVTDKEQIQKLFYSPAFIYHHIKDEGDVNCMNGADFLRAMNAIQQNGVVRYQDLPTDCPQSISTDLKNKAFRGIAPTFNRLMEPKEAQNLSIKKALSEGNPVIIVQQGKTMGHAMCVVGYKDDPELPNEGYFEVLDSRGNTWKDNGFARIPYKIFKEQIVYAVEVPPLLELPKTGKPVVDSVQQVKSFKSEVYLRGENPAKIELKTAVSELTNKKRGAGVGKRTKSSHYIAAQPVTKDFGYQVWVDNAASAYVYILNFDSRKVVDLLFPHNDTVSPYMGKQSGITLPSDDEMIFFDDNKGVDYCCILLSNKPLDMKELKQKIEAEAVKTDSTGKSPIFAKCLETVLGEKLAGIGDDSIKYDAEKHVLNLNMKTDKNIAAMIIEFEHK